MTDPLDQIALICKEAPADALSRIADVLGLKEQQAGPGADNQQVRAVVALTERQRKVVLLALYRFVSEAYDRANHAAQKGPTEAVAKFQDDAKDAEAVIAILNAQTGQQAAVAVGWKVVPENPTIQMRRAGNDALKLLARSETPSLADRAFYVYKAMLDAAPTPPESEN